MFCYNSCRPVIGYSITALSQFSAHPNDVHFQMLKGLAKYLRKTITWGIEYKKTKPQKDLPKIEYDYAVFPSELPTFPVDITQPKLIGFVDAAHGNNLRKRRSTTGYVFTYCGGAIIYRSSTQELTTFSSTEAEFVAAVSAAKTARYIRMILEELFLPELLPTPIYEDNKSAIKIINNNIPTPHTRHLELQFFAIQDWVDDGTIIMKHIKGILNPSDAMTKPLGWVLHSRHVRRFMGHFHV